MSKDSTSTSLGIDKLKNSFFNKNQLQKPGQGQGQGQGVQDGHYHLADSSKNQHFLNNEIQQFICPNHDQNQNNFGFQPALNPALNPIQQSLDLFQQHQNQNQQHLHHHQQLDWQKDFHDELFNNSSQLELDDQLGQTDAREGDWCQEFDASKKSVSMPLRNDASMAREMYQRPLYNMTPLSPNYTLQHDHQNARQGGMGMNQVDWNKEFEMAQKVISQESKTEISALDDRDALAKTAGVLADIIQESSNPKFKNSAFLSMMQQFRDKDIAIEGTKVVQQIPAASSLAPTEPAVPIYQDLHPQQQPSLSSPPLHEVNKLPSSFEMAQEFLASNGQHQQENNTSWEEDIMSKVLNPDPSLTHYYKPALAPPLNYKNAALIDDVSGGMENVKQKQGPSSGEPVQQFSSDVSHDMDWSGEFQSRLEHLDEDSSREKMLYEADTVGASGDLEREFQEKLNVAPVEMTPEQSEKQWRDWERLYEVQNPDISTQVNPFVEAYSFVAGNPFLQAPTALLSSSSHANNVTESILCLEASVQRDPQNSQSWLELGWKQQENENESAAISALSKAIEIDANNLEAYLAIAVSYTNENLTLLAQKALIDWMRQNPKYSHIPVSDEPYTTSSEAVESVTGAFMHAATLSAHDVDADVQQALGVLFNIANDYSKAIDCFQTAVSVRPNDYQLWNKLGATFANSGESEKAMESYFNAIQINPVYIRARYNLAIACMQMGQYHEAAGYLLSALSIQEQSLKEVITKTTPEMVPEMRSLHTGQSDSVWNGLKMLVSSYIRRDDLTEACDARDLNAFRGEFDF